MIGSDRIHYYCSDKKKVSTQLVRFVFLSSIYTELKGPFCSGFLSLSNELAEVEKEEEEEQEEAHMEEERRAVKVVRRGWLICPSDDRYLSCVTYGHYTCTIAWRRYWKRRMRRRRRK